MLKLYNSLTRKKEEFKPIHPGKVGIYVCGPTVYDHCHLGHARGYVSMDVMMRYLKYLGHEIRFIMNYTDVGHLVDEAESGEDKIEKRAKKEKVDPIEIADKYIESCKEDLDALNVIPANFNPRPTRYVDQIIRYVEELIEKDFAYVVNGSVYFSVENFPEYGKLSGRKKDELLAGARVEKNPEKKNPLDFAVWIKAPKEHVLKWESPWGIGYPGWHIECSVMSNDLLGGDTFDIHGGGNENIFPHNENEIAQSEAYLGKPMVNFWLLWNMVNVEGKKMSKSLGNFTTIKEALKNYDPMVVRLWVLSSQYRTLTNFSKNSLEQAKSNFERISDFINNLKNIPEGTANYEIELLKYKEKFESAMDDDLNTPLALSIVYEMITDINKLMTKEKIGAQDAKNIISFWERINEVLGLEIKEFIEAIPSEIMELAKNRENARKEKDFEKGDKIREKIEKKGYLVEDTKDGQKIRKK